MEASGQFSPEIKVSREPNLPNLRYTGKSEASISHPERNEDAIGYNAQHGIAMVLDGVGGLHGGDRASRAARDVIAARLKPIPISTDPDTAKGEIGNALIEASTRVLAEVPGAGATAVVAKFLEVMGERRVIIGSVGDSRAYILRGGVLRQITEDDSTTAGLPLEERRVLDQKLALVETQQDIATLNQRERGYWHTRNVILQMLGDKNGTPKPHVYQVALQSGDKVILTSDGVHDNLSHREMEQIAKEQPEAAEELVRHAKARSADNRHTRHKPDDISAVVVDVEPEKPPVADRIEENKVRKLDRISRPVQPEQGVRPSETNSPQSTENPVQAYDLSGGKEVTITYAGKPIKIILPSGQVLEIGDRRTFNMNGSNVDFLIINRKELTTSKLQAGFKGLREGERVILGRQNPGRFRFADDVSRQHLEIRREKGRIIIRDLNSKNGTKVEI